MEINYPLIAAVALAAILLLVFLIRRNQKDKKDFEQEFKKSELDPEKHSDKDDVT